MGKLAFTRKLHKSLRTEFSVTWHEAQHDTTLVANIDPLSYPGGGYERVRLV